ncbi:unnamed protein product, partial [Rotaria sp. Silwood2]
FITHIRNLSGKTNSNQTDLQRAAEGLLWKLENEAKAVAKSTNVNYYKYDIMISYSHKDKDICLEIHDRLVKDGHNVWLDRDCLRGPTMIGIADAIENSEHVLICMSSTYKQSVYCQSEAHYAYERGCRLIPILIESNYKPDGWLGIIVSGKIYVEFGKIDFHLAYNKLKNEISARHYDLLTRSLSRVIEKDPIHNGSKSLELFQGICESIDDLPDCITEWTHDQAIVFLRYFDLDKTILLLCRHVDGYRLLQLYEMCLMNRESMYQSLKYELSAKHHILLPIDDYLTFLQEVKPYVSYTTSNILIAQPASVPFSYCNLL